MKTLLSQTDLSSFDLSDENISRLNERTLLVTKWNWDYALAYQFQKHAVKLVQESDSLRILICTSHPEVLTNGRGLQRPRKGEVLNLVEFNPKDHAHLPYPLHQIERGGGLTFHHPGQFIFYPIVKLNPKTLSLSIMIDQIFDFSIEVLKDWGIKNIHHENKLLGLWSEDRKLASMGIAIEKLVTFHGMALNIKYHPKLVSALRTLNPCGLNPETYISVEELITLPPDALNKFQQDFLKRINHEWK